MKDLFSDDVLSIAAATGRALAEEQARRRPYHVVEDLRDDDGNRVLGYTRLPSGEISIDARVYSGPEKTRTLAHELSHVYDLVKGKIPYLDDPQIRARYEAMTEQRAKKAVTLLKLLGGDEHTAWEKYGSDGDWLGEARKLYRNGDQPAGGAGGSSKLSDIAIEGLFAIPKSGERLGRNVYNFSVAGFFKNYLGLNIEADKEPRIVGYGERFVKALYESHRKKIEERKQKQGQPAAPQQGQRQGP